MPLLAVIPAYNEAASLPGVVRELRAHFPRLDILIVDDRSEDGTRGTLEALGVRWLSLPCHLGLGGAMRAGLHYARGAGFDTVVRLDGDGQHRADQIEHLLEPIREGMAEAVQGSRYLHRSARRGGPRRLGQRTLAAVLSVLLGRRVTDPTSGFWAFSPRAVRILGEHHPTGYPEPELLLFLKRNGLAVAEVAVEMRDRVTGRSSLTAPRMGLALARVLLAMVVVPLRASVGGARHD
jgi:glycosyltransferase involved in cell wall biosynthesis